jgi:hypothetical protein
MVVPTVRPRGPVEKFHSNAVASALMAIVEAINPTQG